MSGAFFGKIPAKADFVRVDGAHGMAWAFLQWLEQSIDKLKATMQEVPESPMRLIFPLPDSTDVVVAVLAPSHDQVGRRYPLVIYNVLKNAASLGPFSALPIVAHPFMDGAEEIISASSQLSLEQLASRVDWLPNPGAAEWANATQICERTLQTASVADFQERVFGEASSPQRLYAYQTLLSACGAVKGHAPQRLGTILDCPVTVDVDLFAWLELTRRALQWRDTTPAAFWIEEPSPRLLISLGQPSPSIFSLLRNPTQSSNLLWPLTSQRGEAIERARESISGILAPVIARDQVTLGELCDTIEQRASV